MAVVAVTPQSKPTGGKRVSPWPGRVLDVALVVSFLGLTFLLGVFPLKDTDFWWHLKEGDLIRSTGTLPTVDTFTFGAEGRPWIDLHWTYQVLLSWGYEVGGVPLLTFAKCVVTGAAVFLLISARKRDWPWGATVVAWLPALIVLGGRMYIRPETITLLYLSAYLAVLFRLDERPSLIYVLPFVQVLWVNVQGLFVLGPALLAMYLVGAALGRDAFSKKRRRWWITIARGTGLVGIACLVNPYGLTGALYPLQLLSTMGDPIFSKSIGELQSIPDFIARAGYDNLPLAMHFATIALGALSFVLPILWRLTVAVLDKTAPAPAPTPTPASADTKKSKPKKKAEKPKSPTAPSVAPSLFRLLLFLSFTLLSMKATRNSHQFAAVVGTVTAWNFGEWFAAMRARSEAKGGVNPRVSALGKGFALAAVVAVIALVGSGRLYAWMGEGRTIGFGEEPHWFPRAAVEAAGRPGMPNRSVCFHNGHAAFYEYAHAPERKTYADARLEVVGPELYARYLDLQQQIKRNAPGWRGELARMGNPLVLVDNVHPTEGALNATMIAAPEWECVWFDPVAAVYVHRSNAEAAKRDAVDFLGRHFSRFAESEPADPQRHLAQAKAYWNIIYALVPRPNETPRPNWREVGLRLIPIGLDHVRRHRALEPEALEGWKYDGLIEYFRDTPPTAPVPRFRMGFDPVQDLSAARAAHSLTKARSIAPEDGNTLVTLMGIYQARGLDEAALEVGDAFVAQPASTPERRVTMESVLARRPQLVAALGQAPATDWKNLNDLNQILNQLLAQGRAGMAADLLEKAYPAQARPWSITDRIATYLVNLGRAEEARKLWSEAKDAPSPALPAARGAAAAYAAGDLDAAREGYRAALVADNRLFEARYGLAVTEFDSSNAAAALEAATAAAAIAPDDASKSAALAIAETCRPYAAAAPAGR